MELEFLWKTASSQTGECPALYKAVGGYVVQGKYLDGETETALRDRASDEGGVFVPADVLDRLVEQRITELGLA
jgi:hypothetical protein